MDLDRDGQITNLYRIQEENGMAEEQACLEGIYTYTYDQFTVFFYENHIFIGGKEYPVGQCCVDVVNLDEAILKEIDRSVWEYIPAAQALLTEKNRQRRNSRTGEAERCLEYCVFFAGLSGSEYG